MKKNKTPGAVSRFLFRILRGAVKLFYPKTHVPELGGELRTDCVFVGNHAQLNGPIISEIYFPGKRRIWCAWQMMVMKEVPAYAYEDFWGGKPRYTKWFFKLLSYIIAPLCHCVFNNAHTIPVYHDARVVTTFKQTVNELEAGGNIIIFPETRQPYNRIVNKFQDRFISVARLYYRRTGKCLSFVPMYTAPALKRVCFGKPIVFCPEANDEQERERICKYLMDSVTELATGLPRHRVVPYDNIPPKDYPYNISE